MMSEARKRRLSTLYRARLDIAASTVRRFPNDPQARVEAFEREYAAFKAALPPVREQTFREYRDARIAELKGIR